MAQQEFWSILRSFLLCHLSAFPKTKYKKQRASRSTQEERRKGGGEATAKSRRGSVNAGNTLRPNWTFPAWQWSLKASNYLPAPIEKCWNCFPRPLKSSTHKKAHVCIATQWHSDVCLFIFKEMQGKTDKFCSKVSFLCFQVHHLPLPGLGCTSRFPVLKNKGIQRSPEEDHFMLTNVWGSWWKRELRNFFLFFCSRTSY